jgi:O-antigen ligase
VVVHFVKMFERRALLTGFALLSIGACVAAILLSQSRGGLLAATSGIIGVAALAPGKRLWRVVFASAFALVLVVALIFLLDPGRTVRRYLPSEIGSGVITGRTVGIFAGVRIWERFPLFGSGLGTFPYVVSLEQEGMPDKIFRRAHNDYVEIAATAGGAGALIAFVSLIAGFYVLAKMTFGAERESLAWRRRAFQAAALGSLAVAMVHALYDFNFFIPSNPATLAVILGAAVSSVDHDKRTRR